MPRGHVLAMSLRRAYLTLHREADHVLQPLDLTADQYAVLAELVLDDGRIQRELAEQLASDANTVAAILKRLEQKGWIHRSTAPGDARVKQVWLTAAGRAIRSRAAKRLSPLWRQLDSSYDELLPPLIQLCRRLASTAQLAPVAADHS